jgi:hypothetical protein
MLYDTFTIKLFNIACKIQKNMAIKGDEKGGYKE